MNPVYVEGIGLYAPGLVGWEQSVAVLAGRAPYVPAPPPRLAPALLAPDVRRRTTDHIRLAVEVAGEAVRQAQCDAAALASVFASSESDGAITHNICEEVARPTPEVSPTRFHNSVNNAPAGYWCMAVGSQQPSTSIAAFDGTFAAGLLEACAQVLTEGLSIILVAHDTPLPEPLNSVRPMGASFGTALVLTAEPTARSLGRLSLTLPAENAGESVLSDPALEALRRANPVARALPLLTALARQQRTRIALPYVGGQTLGVTLEPVA
jgi:hypothetical protein